MASPNKLTLIIKTKQTCKIHRLHNTISEGLKQKFWSELANDELLDKAFCVLFSSKYVKWNSDFRPVSLRESGMFYFISWLRAMRELTFQNSKNLLFCCGNILRTTRSVHLILDIHRWKVLQAVNFNLYWIDWFRVLEQDKFWKAVLTVKIVLSWNGKPFLHVLQQMQVCSKCVASV